jgi:hypothetical protein
MDMRVPTIEQMNAVGSSSAAIDKTVAALRENLEQLDVEDPDFTAMMRRYGVLDQMSALLHAVGDLTGSMRPIIACFEDA